MSRGRRLLVGYASFPLRRNRADICGDSVDGAAWRTQTPNMGGFKYPDFLLGDEVVTGVKGGKKSKL